MAIELQKYKTSLLGAVNKNAKEVLALVKDIKVSLLSITRCKSGDVTVTTLFRNRKGPDSQKPIA